MSDGYYLGADLGGTSLRLGAVAVTGEVLADVLSAPTGRAFDPEALQHQMKTMAQRLRRSLGESPCHGVGFGTAGVVHEDGPLSHADNLPHLAGANVRGLIEESLGCPVVVENDARCFTLAETRFGAARGARNVCGLTLGTGIGCGVIVNGKLIRGVSSQAGEVCRIPFREHHLEYYTSAEGLVREFEQAGGAPGETNGARLAELAREGSAPALAAWRSYGTALATLCEFVVALVEPEVIVFGGSLAQAHDLFEGPIRERIGDRSTRVAWAQLGPRAGVIGAAVLAMPRERTRVYRRSARALAEPMAVEATAALKLKSEGAL